MNKKGFTLIELMVAIAIVAVLATIGFTLFQNTQAQARDTRRKQDIDAISSVFEQNFSATRGTYAVVAGTSFATGQVPTDPITRANYNGSPGVANATTYVVCARLEQASGNSSDNSGTYAQNGNYYCRKNQQQ